MRSLHYDVSLVSHTILTVALFVVGCLVNHSILISNQGWESMRSKLKIATYNKNGKHQMHNEQKLMRANTNRLYELMIGGIFVATAVLLNFKFMGSAVVGLNVGLIIAYFMWLFVSTDLKPGQNKVGFVYLLAIAIQCIHLCEEYLMDFHIKFPGLFGYHWSDKLFVIFNLIWLFVFVLAALGVLHKVRLAYLVVWTFALIGGIGNGIAHPVLSIIRGGYFPGLITSFPHLVVGVLLIKELVKDRQTTNVSIT